MLPVILPGRIRCSGDSGESEISLITETVLLDAMKQMQGRCIAPQLVSMTRFDVAGQAFVLLDGRVIFSHRYEQCPLKVIF